MKYWSTDLIVDILKEKIGTDTIDINNLVEDEQYIYYRHGTSYFTVNQENLACVYQQRTPFRNYESY